MKLANSQNESSAPKVSKLPLPISDSPLVIDLPDGQKIVVGKMTQGSVIEVATWRGVGRPDSRTSRLMLGVGNGNVNEDSDSPATSSSQTQSPAKVKQKGFAGFVASSQDLIKNFSRINWGATFKALFSAIIAKGKRKKIQAPSESQSSSVVPSVTISPVSEDAEIEAWLNKITEKAARETTKSRASSTVKPAAKKAAVTKKAAPKSANKRK